jgi:hypothetical protein
MSMATLSTSSRANNSPQTKRQACTVVESEPHGTVAAKEEEGGGAVTSLSSVLLIDAHCPPRTHTYKDRHTAPFMPHSLSTAKPKELPFLFPSRPPSLTPSLPTLPSSQPWLLNAQVESAREASLRTMITPVLNNKSIAWGVMERGG